jgi:hypothetical protein
MLRTVSSARPFIRSASAAALIALSGCLSVEGSNEGLGVLTVVSGNNQSLTTNSTTASEPLVVRALDQLAGPLGDVEVQWTVFAGGGRVTPTASITDGAGNASTAYIPGSTPGTVLVRASAEGLTVTFTINVTAPST